MIDIKELKDIAEVEFSDIVEDTIVMHINEIKIFLIDGSFIDIWFSLKLKGRYSYHWERRHIDGTIYRHDNAPHKKWHEVKTFPKHFHKGSENLVVESNINSDIRDAVRKFLEFARKKLKV